MQGVPAPNPSYVDVSLEAKAIERMIDPQQAAAPRRGRFVFVLGICFAVHAAIFMLLVILDAILLPRETRTQETPVEVIVEPPPPPPEPKPEPQAKQEKPPEEKPKEKPPQEKPQANGYQQPSPPAVEVIPRVATGHGVSEAPRGVLYHRYAISADGLIRSATIIPPTSQNQAAIEDDLRRVAAANLHLDDAGLTRLCERVIRNYDPCISCAAHFLTLTVHRA